MPVNPVWRVSGPCPGAAPDLVGKTVTCGDKNSPRGHGPDWQPPVGAAPEGWGRGDFLEEVVFVPTGETQAGGKAPDTQSHQEMHKNLAKRPKPFLDVTSFQTQYFDSCHIR